MTVIIPGMNMNFERVPVRPHNVSLVVLESCGACDLNVVKCFLLIFCVHFYSVCPLKTLSGV